MKWLHSSEHLTHKILRCQNTHECITELSGLRWWCKKREKSTDKIGTERSKHTNSGADESTGLSDGKESIIKKSNNKKKEERRQVKHIKRWSIAAIVNFSHELLPPVTARRSDVFEWSWNKINVELYMSLFSARCSLRSFFGCFLGTTAMSEFSPCGKQIIWKSLCSGQHSAPWTRSAQLKSNEESFFFRLQTSAVLLIPIHRKKMREIVCIGPRPPHIYVIYTRKVYNKFTCCKLYIREWKKTQHRGEERRKTLKMHRYYSAKVRRTWLIDWNVYMNDRSIATQRRRRRALSAWCVEIVKSYLLLSSHRPSWTAQA